MEHLAHPVGLSAESGFVQECVLRPLLYPRHRAPITLRDYERAFKVFLRDSAMTRLQLECGMAVVRDEEERGRALQRDASGIPASDMVLALAAELHAEQP
ncbi:hypothetical protein F6X37_11030 [Paraburkholderia sp. 31.1]|uniref:hypothetical protein n=1 Tax=Paraburkholderia sp. 31.1 TaxID=2615205 RepID=UPI001655056C|nr:hypothetical protein [Paraburkholderia sp. 31.1]MBC8722107.1 hypothetical protein [Paraburkholderia sp. 31.1]